MRELVAKLDQPIEQLPQADERLRTCLLREQFPQRRVESGRARQIVARFAEQSIPPSAQTGVIRRLEQIADKFPPLPDARPGELLELSGQSGSVRGPLCIQTDRGRPKQL